MVCFHLVVVHPSMNTKTCVCARVTRQSYTTKKIVISVVILYTCCYRHLIQCHATLTFLGTHGTNFNREISKNLRQYTSVESEIFEAAS